jgi:hypothetical protein
MFNESFDVQLLNLKSKDGSATVRRRTPSTSSVNSASYLLSSSSTSSLTHTDLIRNLNKLYNNEQQLNLTAANATQLVDYFDNAHYDEEFQLEDMINSTALFLSGCGKAQDVSGQFDLTANETIIGANQTAVAAATNNNFESDNENNENNEINDDSEEYFFNDKNLFRTFIHQSVLSSSFNNKNVTEIGSRLLFAPSIFRFSPKQQCSATNKSGLRKFRARKQTSVKKPAKRTVAFKKSTRRGRNSNKLNLKSKPIERLLTNIEPAFVKMPTATNNQFYKRSFKVEKLLNDSRGMKKYLIDYDCMFSVTTSKLARRSLVDCEDTASVSMSGRDEMGGMSSNVSMCGDSNELTLDSTDMYGLDLMCCPKASVACVGSSGTSVVGKMNNSNSFSSSSSNRCSSGYLSDSN